MAYLGRKGQTAALNSADLPTNSISTAHLINDSVTSAKIGVDVIVAEDIAANAVTVAEISDDAVTADKLADSINTDIATGVTANTTANAALPKSGGTMTGGLTVSYSGEVKALFENTSTSASQFAYVDIESNAASAGQAIVRFKTPQGTSKISSLGTATEVTLKDGNVGIGTDSPDTATGFDSPCFEVAGTDPSIVLSKTGADSIAIVNHSSILKFINDTDDRAFFQIHQDAPANSFYLSDNGNVGIGTTTTNEKLTVQGDTIQFGTIFLGSWNNGYALQSGGASGATALNTLYWANTQLAAASDERIKKNIVDSELNAIETLLKIRIVDFEWNDPSQAKAALTGNDKNARGIWTGFIAQEAVEHIPTMIEAPRKEGVIDHESEALWIVDPSASIPILMKAIQELSAKVTALENV